MRARSERMLVARPHVCALAATAGLLVNLAACGATHRDKPATPKATTPAASASVETQPASSSGSSAGPPARFGERTVIKTPGAPASVSRGFGSIWVDAHRGLTLYRIDPRTNGVTAISMPDGSCAPPVMTPSAVWYMSCDNGDYKLDPKTNRVVGHSPCCVVAYGAGSLWKMAPNTCRLLRLDPRTGVVLARIRTGIPAAAGAGNDGCSPVAVAYGSVWVYSPTAVARVDTATNKLTRLITLPGGKDGGDVAGGYLSGGFGTAAGGKVWVTNGGAGVFAIDARTNTARLLPIKVKPFSVFISGEITAGDGSVWFRSSDHTIARVNAATGSLTATYPGDGGGGLAYADGSLWLAEFADDTTWRERLK